MSLIRLAYASTATFKAMPLEQGIEPNVSRILLSSRRNNPKKGLVGGLYYGDGHFFQYLEGDESAVHELYDRIKRDDRHKDVKTLIEEPLKTRTFSNWSMKYVPVAGDVGRFLRDNKLSKFDPYQFDSILCEQMIELVRASSHDDKLVNYGTRESRAHRTNPDIVSKGIRNGLIAAAVVLVAAVMVGGIVLF
ncbi:BLUF domain-containing protein [Marinobacter changyiensis]|uniref:BLUF domain-containing protein n=1 Tax=Marinobacter changyiensis TaxID=2604091 RepID=UPI00126572A4|nr:BLUF domain-containing protein [Marinobacter changyiensis]